MVAILKFILRVIFDYDSCYIALSVMCWRVTLGIYGALLCEITMHRGGVGGVVVGWDGCVSGG